ncbi:MAG: S-adenosylmethionine:tRNA ribosyltransferase-isomerase, partial [Nocardioides sp.]
MTILTLRPTTTFQGPATAFADAPAEARGLRRDQVRLLVADPEGVRHTRFADLPYHLRPGDLVVVNNSATVNGQLDGSWENGGSATPVVLHVGSLLDDLSRVVELRTAPDAGRSVLDAEPGDVVRTGGATASLVAPYPAADSSPTGSGNR